jgi:hypothetical protein
MTRPQNAASAAKRAGGEAEETGERVENSKAFGILVTVGLLAYGVVHLLVAWIALQLAWTGSNKQASQKGAFQEMASTTFGDVLVWITAVGLFALALWQIFEAIWGHRDAEEGRKRIVKRLGSAGKAVVYVVLGVSAASTAAGSSSSGSNSQKTMTAKILALPFGRVLVIAIGIGVLVVGGRLVYRGVKKKFVKDLAGGASQGVLKLGQVGYIAKGTAFAIVGVLFVIAAITFDPNKGGGLDSALRTLRNQAYGPILLTIMALGIACFGLYCFAWSRRVKKT